MMKINKIKEMSSPELEKELSELKSELFKLRFNLAANGLENPVKIREVKKDIARIKTIRGTIGSVVLTPFPKAPQSFLPFKP